MANEIYNTSWWGTALDTARTAGTNPDFFGSQMKLLTSEQDNLVTNGDFTTDSNWTKLSNTTISGGKANFSNAGGVSLYQNIGVLSGSVKVTFSVTDYTSGGLKIYVGGYSIGTSLIEATAVGDYTVVMDTTSGNGNIIFGSTNNFTGSIDNVSAQLVRCDLDQIEAKKCLADWIHTTALKDLNN